MDEKLLQHILWHDRKCTLACFQSRCQLQRLLALAAALQRIGLKQQHDALIQLTTTLRQQPSEKRARVERSGLAMRERDAEAFVSTVPEEVALSSSPACSPSPKIEALASRIAALEAWAHAFDGTQPDNNPDVNQSLSKATELIQQIAQQSVTKLLAETSAPSPDAIAALTLHVDDKIDAAVSLIERKAAVSSQIASRVKPSRISRIPQPADGHCLYHALAAGLGDGTSAMTLKQEISSNLRADLTVAGVPIQQWQAWEIATHEQDRLQGSAGAPAHWGGAVEIATFAALRRVSVRVFQPPSDPHDDFVCVASFGDPQGSQLIDLLYSEGNHYDLLVVTGSPAHTEQQLKTVQNSLADISVWQAQLVPRLDALDKVHKHLTDRAVSLRGQGIPDASNMCAKMEAIEKRVADCANACTRAAMSSRCERAQSPPGSSPELQPLLKAHTDAISETWKWTSSLILAVMQQRSTNLQVHQTLIDHKTQFARIAVNARNSSSMSQTTSQVSALVPAADQDVATDTSRLAAPILESHPPEETRIDPTEEATAATTSADAALLPADMQSTNEADAQPPPHPEQ
eukprot:5644043-Amphidinium_carterae.1